MKRSEVNKILRDGERFMRAHGFHLPPFAAWTPDEVRAQAASGILDARLGWDVTDFGSGRFAEVGLFLFTLRNGNGEALLSGKGGMVYAEKIMIARDGQKTPVHRHLLKVEDIINRGGGTLVLQLWNLDPAGGLDQERDVVVSTDGVKRKMPAGGKLALAPGESVTLVRGLWHGFWAEGGDVLIGEVSTVNDDEFDNVFAEPVGRFAAIEEDEAPVRLLVSDYGTISGSAA